MATELGKEDTILTEIFWVMSFGIELFKRCAQRALEDRRLGYWMYVRVALIILKKGMPLNFVHS
jgi:hypothetical protein